MADIRNTENHYILPSFKIRFSISMSGFCVSAADRPCSLSKVRGQTHDLKSTNYYDMMIDALMILFCCSLYNVLFNHSQKKVKKFSCYRQWEI